MHLLKSGVAVLALTAFAAAPAQACPWDKTAKAEDQMTVAETATVPQVDTDVAIATNDLSDDILTEPIILPESKPAE